MKALSQFVVAFTDLEHHHKAAAKKEAKSAAKTFTVASKLTATADSDLGLPAGA